MNRQIYVTFLSLASLLNIAQAQTYKLIDLGADLRFASYAQAINNKSQVVGYWNAPDGVHAFLYESGQLMDLGSLGGTNVYALSINGASQIAGVAETGSGLQAFVYDNGAMSNLGPLGGINSYAYGINDEGFV